MVRGKVGIALGGGAARGWAHIGVLRALAQVGVVPDIIAGTSIGAVVGGCFAAGRLDELEGFARDLTKRKIFGYLDFNLSGSGLITGQRVVERLEGHLKGLQIEEMASRFAAVATEFGTGQETWITRGPLVEAMRTYGIDFDGLGEYLYARHAKERNAYIRTIDPDNDAGSGMTDAEADAILNAARDALRLCQFDSSFSRLRSPYLNAPSAWDRGTVPARRRGPGRRERG